ncbi:actin-related protein 1 family [Kipferlia bialata]|uniref:Actin-related protein 1 family n=1 Tax=Kipferlia bialata TaxID=797122 RepID=A0A9K3D0C8_9EUKA|nr:actin-related protein 1 family [Kipferlia bialata]|eukprot:g8639.t1
MFSRPLACPVSDTEAKAEYMLEALDVPYIYTQTDAVLGLYGSSRLSGVVVDVGASGTLSLSLSLSPSTPLFPGVVVDVGASGTRCVPIYEGMQVPSSTLMNDVGGDAILSHLHASLAKEGHLNSSASSTFNSTLGSPGTSSSGAQAGYFGRVPKATTILDREVTLPDGTLLTVGQERFSCAEPLFDPSLVGSVSAPIQALTP